MRESFRACGSKLPGGSCLIIIGTEGVALAAAATAITLAGAGALIASLTDTNSAATVTASGSGGVALTLVSPVASVNFSGETGASSVNINGTTTFTGGSGISVVTIGADPTLAVNLGTGTSNEFVMGYDVLLASAAADTAANVSGYSILGTNHDTKTGATTSGFDLSTLATAVRLDIEGSDTNLLAFVNDGAGASATIGASLGTGGLYIGAKSGLTTPAFTLNLGTATTTGIDAASTGVVTLAGYTTLNVISNGTVAAGNINKLSVTDTALTKLVATGAENLTLSGTDAALATVDTSGATGTVVATDLVGSTSGATFTAGTGATTFVGHASASHLDTFTATNNLINTITESAGNAKITVGNGANDIIVTGTGSGTNTISVGSGADVIAITGSTGHDVMTFLAPADSTKLPSVTGAAAGDSLILGSGVTSTSAVHITDGITDTTALPADLNTAIAALGQHSEGWFTKGTGTGASIYVVDHESSGTTFTAGTDYAVQIVGKAAMATSSFDTTTHALTLGVLT